ncbi:TauD/TfdA family dioxygenase [Legionella sp. D16C41]|uniref:TauD/TfdA family dioxygenase n=1 Tax=Legionella sp. D16C41 TaxID=3402688 RepID=UPI003AF54577
MNNYPDVITRFLDPKERLILSQENTMPLVIEAKKKTQATFLQDFLTQHTDTILNDLACYGAILLRGFDITHEETFEKTILSIKSSKGIADAFMSEEGRIPVNNLRYVLHTNAVYKTGGTLYLGGFHSENYYTPDVPTYLAFCCFKPSKRGGETGLINMEKVYQFLNNDLKDKLEQRTFFVAKWLVSEVAARYQLSYEAVENICHSFNLPIIGEGHNRFILMYKPSVFEHPLTGKKALQINLFELVTLNPLLRKCFMNDYQGKEWFWHRFVWRLPSWVFTILEKSYVACASFIYSPTEAWHRLLNKLKTYQASHYLPNFNQERVGLSFNTEDIEELAQLMRQYYSSCLWQKGDILLIDNRKVAHAGMPGAGPRRIRAMICNPLQMNYTEKASGLLLCREKAHEIGYYFDKEHAFNCPAKSSLEN